ncbi:glycosyltransferase [Devosia sp. ZB163]|uniref:glycosyltransferase n=1 Tax=Devosia sp. ZB163 TaxID=3025938 RepID=UPI003FCC73A6
MEKNVEAFLSLDLPGTKIVVGDGPARAELQGRYPDALFLGLRTGSELAEIYRSADVFVFPSRTDTFGNVLLEALASGLPVAAFPVTGPRDILTDPACGAPRRRGPARVDPRPGGSARPRPELHLVALRRHLPRYTGAGPQRRSRGVTAT